ncbi:hypothetical protein [Marinicrinis sediminis]|uniref:NYN domain-containing protein n=1 Tax=Marinicrinis sediminis TaxID=1652465 RepID=A0ABW5RAU2_9BACL
MYNIFISGSKPFEKPLLLYVDNSNIFIEGQRLAAHKGESRFDLRIHFSNFLYMVSKGTFDFSEVVWGGSTPPESDKVWKKLRKKGIKPDLIQRSSEGESETVDHILQLSMHRHTRKYKKNKGTILLCTGDGKGYNKEEGFLYDIKGLVEEGWEFVLFSWTHCCHDELREFAKQKGVYIGLEFFYDQITFIKNGRRSNKVDLGIYNSLRIDKKESLQ